MSLNMKRLQSSFLQEAESGLDASHSVQCVRCHHGLEEYLFTRLPILPHEAGEGHVMLECPKCGHVEFLSRTSPLVGKLQAIPTYVGDGD
jgi:hypothetical protein